MLYESFAVKLQRLELSHPIPLRCLLLVTICAAVHAQSGFVRSGNQPIPGATVTAAQDGKNSVTTTDQDGHAER